MSKEFYIGRQPILDGKGNIYAYELLFRQPGVNMAEITDNAGATARVLINAVQNIGLDNLLGDKKGFINADEKIILEGLIEVLPKERFVIEILETTKVTDELIEKIIEYKREGYIFALDDMVMEKEYYDTFRKLFGVVDIIKIDYMFSDKDKLKKVTEALNKLDAKILAEKVETQEDYDFCDDAGFQLFQGYFFAKPVIISQKSVDPSKAATVQLINMLKNDAEAHELEETIKSYPDLYINLLKFMNSAAFFTKSQISSIKHAIALLGRENLEKWLYLILYAGPNNDSFGNPLLVTAQMRAHTMDSLAQQANIPKEKASSAFLVGMLSLMDVVFNKTIEDVVKEFNISKEVKTAVTEKSGDLGRLLQLVIDYEDDNMEELGEHLTLFGLSTEVFSRIMLASYKKADGTVS